jgi:hypothetical protein
MPFSGHEGAGQKASQKNAASYNQGSSGSLYVFGVLIKLPPAQGSGHQQVVVKVDFCCSDSSVSLHLWQEDLSNSLD